MNNSTIQKTKRLPSSEKDTFFIKEVSDDITSMKGFPYFIWLSKPLVFPNLQIPMISLYLENDKADVFSCRFYITLEDIPRVFLYMPEVEAPEKELSHLISIVNNNKKEWAQKAEDDPIYILMPDWYKNKEDLVEVADEIFQV